MTITCSISEACSDFNCVWFPTILLHRDRVGTIGVNQLLQHQLEGTTDWHLQLIGTPSYVHLLNLFICDYISRLLHSRISSYRCAICSVKILWNYVPPQHFRLPLATLADLVDNRFINPAGESQSLVRMYSTLPTARAFPHALPRPLKHMFATH